MNQHSRIELFQKALSSGNYVLAATFARECLQTATWTDDVLGFYVNYLCSNNQLASALSCIAQLSGEAKLSKAMELIHASILVQAGKAAAAEEKLATLKALNQQELEEWCLIKAALFDLSGQNDLALAYYTYALMTAQSNGGWLDDRTTDPVFRQLVRRAVYFTRVVRKEFLYGVIGEAGFDEKERVRVDRALALYLGELTVQPNERRHPSFLFIDELPAHPVFPDECFPCLDDFASNTDHITAEFMGHVYDRSDALDAVHKTDDPERLKQLINGQHGARSWSAFYFYRHGERNDKAAELCPVTSGLIESAPVARVQGHSPEICFSLLMPGAKILPHVGVTNARSVLHVPLIIPGSCALEIETFGHKMWERYKPFVFDDTFTHQAWNDSSQIRVVLLADLWNPYLTEGERYLIDKLIVAIGSLRETVQSMLPALTFSK